MSVAAKPSRNELCACGSGRKFKHCHGGLAGGAAARTPQTVSPQHLGALVSLVNQDRPAEAEAQAWEALRSHPNAGMLWKILGVAQIHQRKDALQALRRAAELMPRDAEALRNLGSALHDRGIWDEALASLQAALALEPDHPGALLDAADALRGLGRTRDSLPLYQQALSVTAQDVEALNNLGNAYLELGDHQRALEHYERARRLRPTDAKVSGNVGHALLLLLALGWRAHHPRSDALGGAQQPRAGTGGARQARRGGCQLPRGAAAATRIRRGAEQPRQRAARAGRPPGRGAAVPARAGARPRAGREPLQPG